MTRRPYQCIEDDKEMYCQLMRTHPFLASMPFDNSLYSGYDTLHEINRLQAADLDTAAPLHTMMFGPPATGMSFYARVHLPVDRYFVDDKGKLPPSHHTSTFADHRQPVAPLHSTGTPLLPWRTGTPLRADEIGWSDMPPLEELDDSVVIESPIEEID